jgi:uncharacterized protein YqeY
MTSGLAGCRCSVDEAGLAPAFVFLSINLLTHVHRRLAMTLKQQLIDDMKASMKSGEKIRLGVIRLINAGIKQREDDPAVLGVLEKMVKQRRDSISQYDAAGRNDLSRIERDEMAIIEHYLPAKMGEAQVIDAIDAAVLETGATSLADIGKLMGVLKPRLTGKADMGEVSKLVKARLSGNLT